MMAPTSRAAARALAAALLLAAGANAWSAPKDDPTHRFAATCDAPTVHATLLHRNYPLALAEERGWDRVDQVMAEVWR